MHNWDEIRYFLEVCRQGTLKGAAEVLGVNQTTVGRNIQSLEQRLNAKLLEKRSDGYIPTEAGRRALEAVRHIDSAVTDFERIVAGTDEQESGTLRIAMPGAMANHWLIPGLQDFCEKYPLIQWNFLTGGETVNLSKREADLAVRLVKPSQSDLIAKKIGDFKLSLYANKKILEKGAPKKLEDLRGRPFVGLYSNITSKAELSFLKRLGHEYQCIARSAAWSSVLSSVKSGLGYGVLPTFMDDEKGDLVRLSTFGEENVPVWLVLHPDIQKSRRVRLAVDFINKMAKAL